MTAAWHCKPKARAVSRKVGFISMTHGRRGKETKLQKSYANMVEVLTIAVASLGVLHDAQRFYIYTDCACKTH